ncbi:MAG: D-alanyl-D-alanine carboxypeptidase/D-alanyl-D-alanine-endopeptidase [Ignavibacteria bacterium]|nr:D-alanyl-D-alanine carboxypeptidase/D-alanyl-D-alanine-endopeptidase [Ignavibacteria bacterium]
MPKTRLKYTVLVFLLVFTASVSFGRKPDGIKEMKLRLDSLVKTVSCDVSLQVVSASKYDLLYEYRPEIKMIPASITKVITAAVALHYLGTGYDFRTVLYTDDNNLDDGVINGNLYIKGYGDPEFDSNDMIEIIKKFLNKGIKEITGNIIYDESYFDNQYFGLANYYSSDTKLQYWPYVNALSFNKNASRENGGLASATFLQEQLEANSVKVDGIIISGVTPESPKEISRVTHPIAEVLANMNKPSDNHSANMIFKVVGAEYSRPPGTLQKGSYAVIEYLTSIGVARDEFEILEGSGLTRFNYVTSNVYIQLLKYLYDRVNIFDTFYYSLPVAGVDGTLKKRMLQTEAEKNVHAKTGSINGVSTLTGYAISRDNELIIFYIAMNGFKGGNWESYRKLQDAMCDTFCSFSRNQ